MSVDLVHPAVEKVTLVLEGLGGDKIRIDSTSLDQPLTVLPDQAFEIGADRKNRHPTLIVRQPTGSTMMPWAWPRWATGRNEIVTV